MAGQRIRRPRDWPSLPAAVLTAPAKGRRWSWEEERPGARTPLNRLSKNGLKHPVHVHTVMYIPHMPSRKHQRVDKVGTGRRRRRSANCPDIPLPKTTGEIKPNIYAATPHAPKTTNRRQNPRHTTPHIRAILKNPTRSAISPRRCCATTKLILPQLAAIMLCPSSNPPRLRSRHGTEQHLPYLPYSTLSSRSGRQSRDN